MTGITQVAAELIMVRKNHRVNHAGTIQKASGLSASLGYRSPHAAPALVVWYQGEHLANLEETQ